LADEEAVPKTKQSGRTKHWAKAEVHGRLTAMPKQQRGPKDFSYTEYGGKILKKKNPGKKKTAPSWRFFHSWN
jgi:hypothetical protein